MTREEIVSMARDAGFLLPSADYFQEREDAAVRFAELVAAKAAQDERSVCERICALEAAACSISGTKPGTGKAQAIGRCIDAIRARGK